MDQSEPGLLKEQTKEQAMSAVDAGEGKKSEAIAEDYKAVLKNLALSS